MRARYYATRGHMGFHTRDGRESNRTELEGAMAMTGKARLDEIDRSVFWKSRVYRE
jgi:isopentenyl diphosphate isomerase/L-lactate dehydrogenase-like FMN-dependent dehydrogenase